MTKATEKTTAKTATVAPEFEIPADMRAFAEKSVDQAKVIYGQFKDAAQEAVDMLDESNTAFKSATTDFHATAIDFAQANANAGFDFARKLVGAKDVKEVFELQTEFAREQAKAYTDQAKQLGEMSTKVTEQAFKPLKDGMTKSVEQFKTTFPV
jgi:phasin